MSRKKWSGRGGSPVPPVGGLGSELVHSCSGICPVQQEQVADTHPRGRAGRGRGHTNGQRLRTCTYRTLWKEGTLGDGEMSVVSGWGGRKAWLQWDDTQGILGGGRTALHRLEVVVTRLDPFVKCRFLMEVCTLKRK